MAFVSRAKKPKRELKGASRLTGFKWNETSGVDFPANEEEGWLVIKSQEGGGYELPHIPETQEDVEAFFHTAYGMDAINQDFLSPSGQRAFKSLRSELSEQGFTPAVISDVEKFDSKGVFNFLSRGFLSNVFDYFTDGKEGRRRRGRKPYDDCARPPCNFDVRNLPAVPRKRRRTEDPFGNRRSKRPRSAAVKPSEKQMVRHWQEHDDVYAAPEPMLLPNEHRYAILEALEPYGLAQSVVVKSSLIGSISDDSIVDLVSYLTAEGVPLDVVDDISELLGRAI